MKFKLVKCYDEYGVKYAHSQWEYDSRNDKEAELVAEDVRSMMEAINEGGWVDAVTIAKTNDWSFTKKLAATAFLSLLQLIAFLVFLATIFLTAATLEDNAIKGTFRMLFSLVIYAFVTSRISEHVGWIWDVNQDLDFWRKVRIIQERENKKGETNA